MIILTLLILGALPEMTHFWNGIDCYVECMEAVQGLIFSTKQIQTEANSKIS